MLLKGNVYIELGKRKSGSRNASVKNYSFGTDFSAVSLFMLVYKQKQTLT